MKTSHKFAVLTCVLILIAILLTAGGYQQNLLWEQKSQIDSLQYSNIKLLAEIEERDRLLAETEWKRDSAMEALARVSKLNHELDEALKLTRAEVEAITLECEQAKIYGGLVEFPTDKALFDWLKNNPVCKRPYIPGKYVCADFARDLCIAAIADGYWMGLSRISDQRHQRCFTIIGLDVKEIEPIGGGLSFSYTVRTVSSTYRDLDEKNIYSGR